MPANVTLNLYELNTEFITLTITQVDGGAAENLSTATVEVYIKTSADTADADASTVTLVSPTDVTIVDAPNGVCKFRVPSAVVAAPGQKFWRCDILTDSGATRRTAAYGPVSIENL